MFKKRFRNYAFVPPQNQTVKICLMFMMSSLFIYLIVAILGPGGNDSAYHIFWAKYIVNSGQIIPPYNEFSKYEMPRYLPGSHILLSLFYLIFKFDDVLYARYISFVLLIGSIFATYYLTFYLYRSQKISLLYLIFATLTVTVGNFVLLYSGAYPNLIGNILLQIFLIFLINYNITKKTTDLFVSLVLFATILITHQIVSMIAILLVILLLFIPEVDNVQKKMFGVIILGFFTLLLIFKPGWISFILSDTPINKNLARLFPPIIATMYPLSIIAIFGLFYTNNISHKIMCLWFLVTFIMSIIHNLYSFPVNPLRFVYMASYPLSILAAVGVVKISSFKSKKHILMLIFLGIIATEISIIEKASNLRENNIYISEEEIKAWEWIKSKSSHEDVIIIDLFRDITTIMGRQITMSNVMTNVSDYTFKVYPEKYKYTLLIPYSVLKEPDNVNKYILDEYNIKYIYLLNDRSKDTVGRFVLSQNFCRVYHNDKVSIFERC